MSEQPNCAGLRPISLPKYLFFSRKAKRGDMLVLGTYKDEFGNKKIKGFPIIGARPETGLVYASVLLIMEPGVLLISFSGSVLDQASYKWSYDYDCFVRVG